MLVKFKDCVISIKNIDYGSVVEYSSIIDPYHKTPVRTFGHVVGFSRNSQHELLLVLNINKETREIHPEHLIFNIL